MLRVSCPGCGAIYRVPDQQVGRKGKCARCSMVFELIPLAELQPETIVAELVGPTVVNRRPMWMRPVSATLGRWSAPMAAIVMGSTAFFKPGPTDRDVEVKELAYGFDAANTDDELELQLGSSMPLRNLQRIWHRRGIGLFGKILGTLSWPMNEIGKALSRADSYDPFAHSVALYHNDPAILAHELGHAQDFAHRRWRTLYTVLGSYIPVLLLYQEWIASRNAITHFRNRGLHHRIDRANRVLGGGFGTYVGAVFWAWPAIISGPLGQLVGFLFKPFGRAAAQWYHA